MNTPPLLVGAVLMFWGWRAGYMIPAAIMASALEARWLFRTRWDFSSRDTDRLWDFCTGLFLVLAAFAFTSHEGFSAMKNIFSTRGAAHVAASQQGATAALAFLQWLPMIFFPFVLAQAYSTRDHVPLTTFSLLLRMRRRTRPEPEYPVRVGYPYFGVCLASASLAEGPNLSFFAGACILLAWGLCPHRSRRFSWPVWTTAVVASLALGFSGQLGIYQLQRYLEQINPDWFLRFRKQVTDHNEAHTFLGRIGRLKLSSRIVLRIDPKGDPPPELLREASYRKFTTPVWRSLASREEFSILSPETNQSSWVLQARKPTPVKVEIASYLDSGRGMLALPPGTAKLDNLQVFILKTNRLGVVMVESGPGLVVFEALYGPGRTIDSDPVSEEDLAVPEKEAAAVEEIATKLNLKGKRIQDILNGMRGYFVDQYVYTTEQRAPTSTSTNATPLGVFLRETHAGHCEHFATAAVLLLRQYGIPARYAVGYSVQERSRNQYVVRDRHAHAWALVYYGGQWHDFDPTPPSWSAMEENRASSLQWIGDLWSKVWFEVNRWRWGQSSYRKYMMWIFVPVALLLAGQLVLKKEWRRLKKPSSGSAARDQAGLDSEFFLLEQDLRDKGWVRPAGETPWNWMRQMHGDELFKSLHEDIKAVLYLHYRYRFDPCGLSASERAVLRDSAQRCREFLRRQT